MFCARRCFCACLTGKGRDDGVSGVNAGLVGRKCAIGLGMSRGSFVSFQTLVPTKLFQKSTSMGLGEPQFLDYL